MRNLGCSGRSVARRLWPAAAVALLGCTCRMGRTADVAPGTTPMARYTTAVLQCCDQVEAQLPELVALAESIADRHVAGGRLAVIWEPPNPTGPQGPQYEMKGRSGGLTAFDGSARKGLAESIRERDVAFIGWQRAPEEGDLDVLRRYGEHFFIVAFGPRKLPALTEHVKLCDAWIDTGLGDDDRLVTLPDGTRAGQGNALVNVLNAWAFQAEVVSALTRRGKMPTLLKSHAWEDSDAWNGRYRGKLRFHDDMAVPAVAPRVLGGRYLDRIRERVRAFAASQQVAVSRAADLIAEEAGKGRRTVVAQTGHTTYQVVGRYEDSVWASPVVLYDTAGRIKQYRAMDTDGALVLRLGYSGFDVKLADVMREKRQRIMLITTTDDARPGFGIPSDLAALIDTGAAFGDACVEIDGYPIRVFPPSGVMQLVAYESVNVEVLSRLVARVPVPSL